MRLPNTIETISGGPFDYTKPQIRVDDVAHGLSNVCRFAGHTSRFYSVAEHSVLVASIVEQSAPEHALAALWHDAHEAYMGDLPTPLKALVGSAYLDIADGIDEAVCAALQLDGSRPLRHPVIKVADELAMVYEASVLKPGPGWEFARRMDHTEAWKAGEILALPPTHARDLFLSAHDHFTED
jgi:hypothetical protein